MRNMVAEMRLCLLGILELQIRVDRNRDNTKWPAGVGAFSRGLSTTLRLRNRSGLRSQWSNEQSHDRGHRDALRSPRATSDWDGVRRATLTHGFVMNTNGGPAYSFPSDSPSSLHQVAACAKLECFLGHGSSPPRRGWFANKALQATAAVLLVSAVDGNHNAVVADASALPAAVPELGR